MGKNSPSATLIIWSFITYCSYPYKVCTVACSVCTIETYYFIITLCLGLRLTLRLIHLLQPVAKKVKRRSMQSGMQPMSCHQSLFLSGSVSVTYSPHWRGQNSQWSILAWLLQKVTRCSRTSWYVWYYGIWYYIKYESTWRLNFNKVPEVAIIGRARPSLSDSAITLILAALADYISLAKCCRLEQPISDRFQKDQVQQGLAVLRQDQTNWYFCWITAIKVILQEWTAKSN